MADALKLAFVLSATDKMSRIITEAVNKSTSKLTAFERNASKVGRSMMSTGGIMAGAGAAISSALLAAGKQVGDYAGDVNDMSEATGVGTEAWQKMAYAAKISGIEQEKLATSMVKFDKIMVDAAAGSKSAGQAFKDLGINLRDSTGKLRAPNEVFNDVAEVLAKTENGAAKTAAACSLFGKSGAELMPLLNKGKAGLTEFYEAAERSGNVIGGETLQACDQFGEKMDAVGIQVKGLGLTVGAALIPILDKLVNWASEMIQKLTDWAKENPNLAATIATVATGLAGLLTVLGGAALLIGGVIFTAGQFAAAWRGIKLAVDVCKTAFTNAKNSMLIFRIQYAALVVQQKLAAAAQWLFNTSLMGCPVVWIVAAVIAIGAAVYLLIKHWDKVTAFFGKLWDGIKKVFSATWDWIKNMFLNYTPHGLIIKHWDSITAWFGRLWEGVKKVFSATWDWIKNMFLNYTPHGLIIKHWDTIAVWFGLLWDGVKNIFSTAWDGISSLFSSLNPLEWISGMWDDVTTFFSGLPARFFDFGRNIITGLKDGIKSIASETWESITNVGEGIKNKFKSFFGINSPSTLFMEYGLNITQGLTGGLEKGTPAVVTTTEGLATTATRNVGDSITAAASNTANTVNNGGGITLNYAPTVNLSGNASPETAAEFTKLLRAHRDEIMKMIRQATEEKQRLSFS